jgi:hypothetical protein
VTGSRYAGRRGKEQEQAQRKNGCLKNLVAARRGTTRCAGRAWRKEDFIGRGRDKENGVLQTRKGTFEKKSWKGWACNSDIRDRGLRQQLQGRNAADLGGGRPRYPGKRDLKMLQLETTRNTGSEAFRKTTRLGIVKRIAGSPVAVRIIKKWTLWRCRPPPKRKKQHWRKKSRVWGAPATLRASAPCVCESAARKSERMWDTTAKDVENRDWRTTCQGAARDELA